MSMQEARNLMLKAKMVMKERIYHDPYQKYQYGGDDNHDKFENVKEVARGESSSSIVSMEKVSNKNPMDGSNKVSYSKSLLDPSLVRRNIILSIREMGEIEVYHVRQRNVSVKKIHFYSKQASPGGPDPEHHSKSRQ
ncbi:hypothetical protein GH714_003149 [Hevea brasiliensis]|uniref:Uncharacterized protein n=1 Tax=Hevea brasiliensis TaxID=3981 RepID=A0A6A6LUX8_HEVBR|nr:hypothetical protein GH714_003149 [Hevea brasiliensis]